MKDNLIGLFFIALFLMSAATTAIGTIGKRSTTQIVIHGSDMTDLTNKINSNFALGYKVTAIQAQSVATTICEYYHITGREDYRDTKGEIMIIMEK